MPRVKKSAGDTKSRKAYRLGLRAEALCRVVLRLAFYRIVAVRYKTNQGEIDVIATRGRTLVFVEIKARASAAQALESVQPRQCTRIARAADVFLAHNPCFNGYTLRFDIMSVSPERLLPYHIKNAFSGTPAGFR